MKMERQRVLDVKDDEGVTALMSPAPEGGGREWKEATRAWPRAFLGGGVLEVAELLSDGGFLFGPTKRRMFIS